VTSDLFSIQRDASVLVTKYEHWVERRPFG
jgi:hypothetical protein